MEHYQPPPFSLGRLRLLGLVLWGLCLLGWWAPESLWGIHYPAFLSGWWGPALLVVAGLAVGFPGVSLTRLQQRVPSWNLAFTGMVVVGFSVLIWFFPVVMDPYGDAPYLVPTFPWIHPEVEAKHVDKVLNMDLLDPKIGTSTVVGLVYILSAAFEVSIQVVWRLLDLAAGALFAGVWLSMVHRARLPRSTACVMGVTGLTAPWLLVFFGHFEIYAFVYLFQLVFWDAIGRLQTKRTGVRVGWLLLVFVLNLKVHVTGWLLLPVVIGSLQREAWTFAEGVRRVLIPVYLIGTAVYFYGTQSAYSSRKYTPDDLLSGVFLPLATTDGPPMDRYDLFSAYHLLDMANLLAFWSLPAVLIAGWVWMEKRQELQWNRGILPKAALTLAIQLPFFFVLNPLLGMPQDWDLFSIPAVTLLVMVLGLGIQIPTLGKAVLNPVLGLSLLSCATVVVNATPELQGPRLLAIGEHQFRAHYMGSSSLVEAGIQRFSAEDQLKQRRAVLERLKEVHVPGNDLEYAGLLDAQGAAWLAATKDPREALKWHQQALESYPLLRTNIYHLVVCHMMVGDPVQAFQFAPTLVAMGHPDPEKSLRMGVHVAVAAGKRLEALEWAQRLRRRDPTRDFYRTLEQQLAGNTPLPTILSLFQPGP